MGGIWVQGVNEFAPAAVGRVNFCLYLLSRLKGGLVLYGYVYMLTNLVSGKKYIGQHKSEEFDKSYYGSGAEIRLAVKELGRDKFKQEVLEKCESPEELNERELYWIDYFDAVNSQDFYNQYREANNAPIVSGKSHPRYGTIHPDESKRKMSEAAKGRIDGDKNPMNQKSARKKHSDRMKQNNVAKRPEVRQKIAEANSNRVISEETRRKLSEASRKRWKQRKAEGRNSL